MACHLHLFLAEEVGWPVLPAVLALVGPAELCESWSFSVALSSFFVPLKGMFEV